MLNNLRKEQHGWNRFQRQLAHLSKLCKPDLYWKIYRGPGFLAIVWFDSSSPHPFSPLLVSKLYGRHQCRKTEKERQLADRRGGGRAEGVGEEPNYTTAKFLDQLSFLYGDNLFSKPKRRIRHFAFVLPIFKGWLVFCELSIELMCTEETSSTVTSTQ